MHSLSRGPRRPGSWAVKPHSDARRQTASMDDTAEEGQIDSEKLCQRSEASWLNR